MSNVYICVQRVTVQAHHDDDIICNIFGDKGEVKMLRLMLGRAGRGKTASIYNEIKSELDKASETDRLLSEYNSVGVRHILIVPEQYSHAAERELCRVCGDKVSLYAEVLSFTRLAERVFSETGGLADTVLDAAGRILAIDTAIKAVRHQLKAYSGIPGKSEFLVKVLESIDEIKSCAVTPEQLERTAEEISGSLGRKLSDISIIAAAYDAVTGRRDPRDRLTKLADVLPDSGYLQRKILYIDGFTDFTVQELLIIKAMLKVTESVSVALTCEGLTVENEIFEISRRTAVTLRNMSVKMNIPVEELLFEGASGKRPGELLFMEKHLFEPEAVKYNGESTAIQVVKAGTVVEECEIAAAQVRRLTKDYGYRYRDIAVAGRGFSDYETTVERIFQRYGIPTYVGKKSDIMQKPVLVMLTSALEVVTGGWRYDSVISYLKTGLTGLTPCQCDKLESYVYMWSIKGSMWERDGDWCFSPGGYGATDDFTQDLIEINKLRRQIAYPLIKLRHGGRRAVDVRGHVSVLYDYLVEIGLPHRLKDKSEEFEKNGDRQLAGEYVQLWSIILQAMEQCVSGIGDALMEQREFAEVFKLTLSQYGVSAIPMSLDRVGIGDMDRMRHRDIKCLIVLGADDERLPSIGKGSGMLTDAERELLISYGLPFTGSSSDRLEREMNLMYNTVTMATEQIIVTWPGTGSDGNMRRPSLLAVRLMEMFGAGDLERVDLSLWAEKPCVDFVLSKEETRARDLQHAAGLALSDKSRILLESIDMRSREQSKVLNTDTAQGLFGKKLTMSASRLEVYGQCHFSYFMQYGLKAKAEHRAEFDAPTAGSFVHFILENVIREIGGTSSFSDVTEKELQNVTDKYIEIYIEKDLLNFRDRTQRFIYLFQRLRRETYEIVRDMVEELGRSDFKPLDFELIFSKTGVEDKNRVFPPAVFSDGDNEISLTGIVDRVDGWINGDILYLRVMDYKTGVKEFSLSDVWYGMSMQMLLYLFVLCGDGRDYFGKKVSPAGVLYAPARDVMLSLSRDCSDSDIKKERNKRLKRCGVLIDDPLLIDAMEHGDEKRFIPVKLKNGKSIGDSLLTSQQLGKLSRHIEKTVIAMGRELSSGNISVNPAGGSVRNPCEYCPYRIACQMEEDGSTVRFLKKLNNKQVFERIDRELGVPDESGQLG